MKKPPYAHLGKGSLLIANPDVDNEYFRSVILLCEQSGAGSFGIMLNQDVEMDLPEGLINLEEIQNPHVQIINGGNMEQNRMLILHGSDQIPEETMEVCEGAYLGGSFQFLQELLILKDGPPVIVSFGSVIWGPGGLEREFLSGDWFLTEASTKYLFETPTDLLWQTLLRNMGGRYATLSMIPEDLTLN